MSDHIESLVADLSSALENREFDRAEGLITDLEEAYDERRTNERRTVEETKRRYAESRGYETGQKETFTGLISESGTTQFTRVAALTLAASVTDAHEELAEQGLLDEHVDAARTSLAELAAAEPSFGTTLQAVDEIDTPSDADGGDTGEDSPFEPPGSSGDSDAEPSTPTPSAGPVEDGPFEPPGPPSSAGEPDSGTTTATSGPANADGSTGEDNPIGPPGLPGDPEPEASTATQSPSPVAGDATATTGSESATSEDESPESDADTTTGDGPGFGLSSTLASVGGVGYLFYRRLTSERGDDE